NVVEALATAAGLTQVTGPISSTISAHIFAHTRTAGTQTSCTTTATTGTITRTRAIGRCGVVRSTRAKHSPSWRRTEIISAANTQSLLTTHRRVGSSV